MKSRKDKKYFGIFVVLLFLAVFLIQISSAAFSGPYSSSFNDPLGGSGQNWQAYQPSFGQLYSRTGGGFAGLQDIWPILRNIENDQCEAASDFVIGIPPAGCTPTVVRSDLLAEQNVPVFCQLYAVTVNPLIDVSSIRSISFKGERPKGVSGITFHPARAATRSYKTLLGDPIINNIGYVVIILKRERVEENMEEWISGNLTATIRYDAKEAFGTGRAEFYLPKIASEDLWKQEAPRSSFWNGKGYVRVLDTDSTSATIQILSNPERSVSTFILEEGQTSNLLYLPGFYCRAGLKVRLNRLEVPEDTALINVDGSDLWVREGTKLLNNACTVRQIETGIRRDGNGAILPAQKDDKAFIRISCPGKTLQLSLIDRATTGSTVTDIANNDIDAEFRQGTRTVQDLVDHYPRESPEGIQETYGEETLNKQILLAERSGKTASAIRLIDLYKKEYPESPAINTLNLKKERMLQYDFTNAIGTVFVNGKFSTIGLYEMDDAGNSTKEVRIKVRGKATSQWLKEGENFTLSRTEKLIIQRILPGRATVRYSNSDANAKPKSDTETIEEGTWKFLADYEVNVDAINVEERAYISIIPEIKHTKTEADFTFGIGIEKRAIQLSPEKTEEMLENINNSIEQFESINSRLEDVIQGWKGACFATSALLTVKNMASGVDGTALARQKVMAKYKSLCKAESANFPSKDACYQAKASEIEHDVQTMKDALSNVNDVLKNAQEGNTVSSGFLSEDSVVNQEQYLKDLRGQLSGWQMEVDETTIDANDLTTAQQMRAALLHREFEGQSGIAATAAQEEVEATLRNVATLVRNKDAAALAANQMNKEWGTSVNAGDILVVTPKSVRTFQWTGTTAAGYSGVPLPEGITDSSQIRVQPIAATSNSNEYLAVLSAGTALVGIETLYERKSGSWVKVDRNSVVGIGNDLVFSVANQDSCTNLWRDDMQVSYYESGKSRGFPAIVPFDREAGWYALVPNAGGTFIDSAPGSYTASGDVNYFKICNIGPNGRMDNGLVDDLCQSFSVHSAGSVDTFLPCPKLRSSEVSSLYNKAREAIRQASSQFGQEDISIFGQIMKAGPPMSAVGGFECTDFMSPGDCQTLFNVCDPVICPSSRCNLGGKYPVTDVVQTGIIGSLALCLPNAQEGIFVPICLTGVHAGLDAYTSILKSEQQCLQHSLATGEYVGICDEITAVYECEFLWGQLSPILDALLPTFLGGLSGQDRATKGGGEYLFVSQAWNNAEQSVNFFRNVYAQNAFRAFNIRSTQEIGSPFCKAFIGTSVPTSADALDSLLAPESPAQFYAYFSEHSFSDATVPTTSQYKVYFHIFAGNDVGTHYRVYLRDPPASSYYATHPHITVKTGYIPRGESADETIDFTAPEGYKELCVSIGAKEECGFRQVTTNFGLDIVKEKYVQDQAQQTDITSEQECISGSPSVLALASPNIQAGAEEALQPEIALRGIVRVCATNNPSQGTDAGARWKDVGHCGESNLRCWLDTQSVTDGLKTVNALEGEDLSIKELESKTDLLTTTYRGQEETRKTLDVLRQEVKELDLKSEDANRKIIDVITVVDDIAGLKQGTTGQGSNAQRAEALAIKAEVYRKIVDEKLIRNLPEQPKEGRPKEGPVCGNAICEQGEDAGNCPFDCGENFNKESKESTSFWTPTIKATYVFDKTKNEGEKLILANGLEVEFDKGNLRWLSEVDPTAPEATISEEDLQVRVYTFTEDRQSYSYYIFLEEFPSSPEEKVKVKFENGKVYELRRVGAVEPEGTLRETSPTLPEDPGF